jgi:ATP-dependent DNA ligase
VRLSPRTFAAVQTSTTAAVRVQHVRLRRLPAGLRGPVPVALARLEQQIPGPHALPGSSVYELKWDGLRLVVVHDGSGVRLWSRNCTDLSERFPDVAAAAAAAVPPGTFLDGEVVIWDGRDRASSCCRPGWPHHPPPRSRW